MPPMSFIREDLIQALAYKDRCLRFFKPCPSLFNWIIIFWYYKEDRLLSVENYNILIKFTIICSNTT